MYDHFHGIYNLNFGNCEVIYMYASDRVIPVSLYIYEFICCTFVPSNGIFNEPPVTHCRSDLVSWTFCYAVVTFFELFKKQIFSNQA
jgi:hypothetical protein